mgnify:CR=1 FL=1
MSVIRIVVADDHPIVRNGLKQLIAEQTDMEVVGEADSGDALLTALRSEQPDVVLCDMSMPGRSGVALIKAISSQAPGLPVLVLSVHEDEMFAVRTVQAGAMGYLSKASPSDQLLAAIRRVASGRLYINLDVAEKLALQTINGNKLPHEALSNREYQVFMMLAKGLTVSVIAEQLHLSVKTISTHKTNIMRKMGLSSLTDLIRYAMQHRLIGVEQVV